MLIQGNCPGCKAALNIPAEWLTQAIKCKHCGMVVQMKKPAAPTPTPPRGSDRYPVSKPAPVNSPTPAPAAAPVGLIPAPMVMARLHYAPPLALRMNGFDLRSNPRGRGGVRQKLAFLGVWVAAIGLLAGGATYGIKYANEISDEAVAVADLKEEGQAAKEATPDATPKDTPKKEMAVPPRPTSDKSKKPMKPESMKEKTSIDTKRPTKTPPPPPRKTTRVPPPPPPRVVVRPTPPPPTRRPTGQPGPNQADNRPAQPVFGSFPRRMLAISVSNYFYFNPVSYGAPRRDTHDSVNQLAAALQIPQSQVFELSDGAATNAKPPLGQLIEKAIDDFVTTSRPQDRIILLFSGHAIEIEGTSYLVPLEGEGADKNTLISLKSVFTALSKCKARQKILILDVCRYDPFRGNERPDSGKMTEKFAADLAKPPDGVQVWASCSQDEYSLEENTIYGNSDFLYALYEGFGGNLADRRVRLPNQTAKDSIPLEELNTAIGKMVEADAKLYFSQAQTPKVYGKEIEEGAAYNPNEKPAEQVRVTFGEGLVIGEAKKSQIQGMIKELTSLPPVKIASQGVKPLRMEAFPTFLLKVMNDYKEPEGPDTPVRVAVKKASEVLKKHGGPSGVFQEEFRSRNVEQLKQQVQPIQKNLAVTQLELEEALENLKAVEKDAAKEPSKRWQADFDYVQARLLQRLAYVFEYQYMLSAIRTDGLPELQANHVGWRLASREKMQAKGGEGKIAKTRANEAKKYLEKLITDHKNTPYEILAKREMLTNLGLEWQPLVGVGGGAMPKKK